MGEVLEMTVSDRDAARAQQIARLNSRTEIAHAIQQALAEVRAEMSAPVEREIESWLTRLRCAAFIVQLKGLECVVTHSDAMHALLYVRKALRDSAHPAPERREEQG